MLRSPLDAQQHATLHHEVRGLQDQCHGWRQEGPRALTNPIHVLDLALVLPAAVLTGVLLLRRRPWGFVLGGYFLVKFVTLGLAIMSMTLVMLADGQPFDVALSAMFSIWTVASAGLTWRFLASVGSAARTI